MFIILHMFLSNFSVAELDASITISEKSDTKSKVKIISPNKIKGFEFSTTKLTSPFSSDTQESSNNPFAYSSISPKLSQSELPESFDAEGNKDSNKNNPFEILKDDNSSQSEIDNIYKSVNADNNIEGSSDLIQDYEKRLSTMPTQISQQLKTSSTLATNSITSATTISSSSSSTLSNLSQSPNQTNIGTTIAGVVGGGASKLQALHKWFKGDSIGDGKEFSKRKNELSDLASVSVREIVKAIGGQDSRTNGNEVTPPQQSRSSSPITIPQSNTLLI